MSELNQYSGIKFPPYKYRPYPRMLYSGDQTNPAGQPITILVENAEEEKALLSRNWHPHPARALESQGLTVEAQPSQIQLAEMEALQEAKSAAEAREQAALAREAALVLKLAEAEAKIKATPKPVVAPVKVPAAVVTKTS